jgi:2-polyprenyl-6-methoxyphenol hydroxylase-like FAD-dependent oxidoreductase
MNLLGRPVKTEVLVVGAGPVGLLVALLLRRQGIAVHVIDEAWRATARSYAAALHPSTLELFAELGIDISGIEATHRLSKIGFYDRDGKRAEALFDGISAEVPGPLIMPQNRLEALLEAELERCGVTVNWSHRLARLSLAGPQSEVAIDVLERTSSGYAYATTTVEIARSYVVHARYVLGADGNASVVRRQLGVKYRSVGPACEFDVFEFQSDNSTSDEMSVLFDGDTTNVLWTLPGGRQRWSFQVDAPNRPERDRVKSRLMLAIPGESTMRTSLTELSKYIEQRATWYKGQPGDIAWAGDVRFEPHLVDAFGRANVWLLGDAAHQTGPVGIQSMNVGLREAHQLATIVARASREGHSASAFADYEAARMTEWRKLLGLEPFVVARQGCDPWLSERLPKIIPCLPASGTSFSILASRLGFTVA